MYVAGTKYVIIIILLFYFRFNRIFACRSFSHLRAVYVEYEKISKNGIEVVIEKEMSGDLRRIFLAIGMFLN